MEVFKSSERYECEELYRAREYNRVREYVAHKEIYRSAEVNIQPEGSLPKADRKKQLQSQLRKKLLMAGSSFSAVVAAVGAAIIIAAIITAAAVLSVKETFSDITSYSIEVQFEIENEDAVELTATLKGGEKPLEYQLGGQDRVYFDFLESSTEYTLEIADKDDKVYFSQAYTTAAYRQEIFPVENGFSGYSILMQFAEEDLTEDGYNVCFDGELLDGRLSKDSPYFRVNGLVPNTMHDLRVYGYGPGKYFASVHVEVDARVPVLEAHEIVDAVERDFAEHTEVELTGHLDPIVTDDARTNALRVRIAEKLSALDPAWTMHDFRVVWGEQITKVLFDLAVPFACTRTEKEILSAVTEAVRREGPFEPNVTVERE